VNIVERIPSSFYKLNNITGGYELGQLTIITGENGAGKSTFIGNELLKFISAGYKVCVYSGELPKVMFKRWINLQACGKEYLVHKHDDIIGMDVAYVPDQEAEKINQWYADKFKLVDLKTGVAKDHQLLDMFTYAYNRYGCKVFVVDNLMMTFFTSQEQDFWQKQSTFIAQMMAFVKQHEVQVLLVAHPRKTDKEVKKVDIAGSANITNMADLVLNVVRLEDKKRKEYHADNLIQVLKNRELGFLNKYIKLDFHIDSKRFYDSGDITHAERKLGWEHS